MTMWGKLKAIFAAWFKKKTSACRLFVRLGRYASLTPTSLCQLHEAEARIPCPSSRFFCGTESQIPALSFDAVKDAFCRNTKTPSCPSVDAALYKGDRFLFVEIKSWQNFERHQIKNGDSQSVIQQKITDKACDFKLKPKVEKSMEMCRDISNNVYLFDEMPVTYVLVTDVDTVLDPLVRFKGQLTALAYKSVFIPLYSSASISQLAGVGMDVRYVFCRKFDTFFDSL